MKRLFLPLLAVVAMTSCAKDATTDPKGEMVAIDFNGAVEVTSKAAEAFDKAYTGVVGVMTASAWETGFDKVGLTIAADGKLTASPEIFIPSAEYTFTSVATDHTALPARTGDTYPLTLGKVSEAATTGGDMIFATATETITKNDKSVALKYDHVYGQVTFAIAGTAGQFTTDEIANATIEVTGFVKSGTLDAKTGAVTNVAEDTYTGVVNTRDVAYFALPQTMDATNFLTVAVTIGGEVYNGTIKDANGTIEKNKTKTITITVSNSGLAFAGTLQDWEVSTPGSGSAQ